MFKTMKLTRWLYCVEYPQYSTRLEAPGYLYVSCNTVTVSPTLRPNSVPGGMLIHPAKWPGSIGPSCVYAAVMTDWTGGVAGSDPVPIATVSYIIVCVEACPGSD